MSHFQTLVSVYTNTPESDAGMERVSCQEYAVLPLSVTVTSNVYTPGPPRPIMK